jgi:hypothetical protein
MNISPAPTFQTDNDSISLFSDFEITSNSPAFSKMVAECFGNDYPISKTYSEPFTNNSKNRAKRARKKSKK